MGHSEYDPDFRDRRAWNSGRKLGAKRALKPQQVWAIRFWLDREGRVRDRALFDLAIDRLKSETLGLLDLDAEPTTGPPEVAPILAVPVARCCDPNRTFRSCSDPLELRNSSGTKI
jgi:hypothetical protein